MNKNYNQYDDEDYIVYDNDNGNGNGLLYDDLIYEDDNDDFQNIDPVEYSNYSENDEYTYETDDDYDESEYSEKNILFENRTKIVVGLVIVLVLALVVWLIPQFIGQNKNNSSETSLTKNATIENDMIKLKQAALKYYEEGTVPTDISGNNKLTLSEMLSKKLIKNFTSSYNKKKSYISLTKLEDEFLLEIKLVYGQSSKKKEYHLSNYSYCTSTYLCEKEDIMDPNPSVDTEEDETVEVGDTESGDDDVENYKYEYSKTGNGKLSDWSRWSQYVKTSCSTEAVTCKDNDFNCLSERKLYNRKEKLGTVQKKYSTSRNNYTFIGKESINGCSNYDYIKVNNIYYKTASSNQFTSVGSFSASSPKGQGAWTYVGRKMYQTPPSDSLKTKYVFVSSESYCENCQSTPTFTYDVYQFNGNLQNVSNINNECVNKKKSKNIFVYNISNQSISVNRTENIYATVCYKSERTRSIVKQGAKKVVWSTYNDESLLNDGYTYTGKTEER